MVSALKKSRAGVKPLKVLKTVLRWAFNIVIALIFFITYLLYILVIRSRTGMLLPFPEEALSEASSSETASFSPFSPKLSILKNTGVHAQNSSTLPIRRTLRSPYILPPPGFLSSSYSTFPFSSISVQPSQSSCIRSGSIT